jgi:uncharacterized protein YukE
MAIEGMDVGAVQGILTQLNAQQTNLENIVRAMPGIISSLEASWKGPDATQFANQWPGHQQALNSALTALQDIHTRTNANMQAQQSTSNTLN